MEVTQLYRYEGYSYAVGEYTTSEKVVLREFKIIKTTPKGYRLESGKWVSSTGKKRYAYPTTEEALIGFKARKTRQIKILKAQLDAAKSFLTIAERI